MQRKLKPALGNYVCGERFWGRDAEIEEFTALLSQGANILLVAQRRMGKTSLMKEAEQRLSDSCHVAYMDLEDSSQPEDVIAKLAVEMRSYTGIWEKVKGVFANVREHVEEVNVSEIGVTLRSGLSSGNWDMIGNRLLEILADSDKQAILLLDEVPIFIDNLLSQDAQHGREHANRFLSWLRAASFRHNEKLGIALTGSIGLEPIVRRVGLSATLNHYEPFDLRPWDTQTAIHCMEALAHHEDVVVEDGVPDRMLELLGSGIPHFVQKFYRASVGESRFKKRSEILLEDVETAYTSRLLGVAGQADMYSYEERLLKVLGETNAPLALLFLTEAAKGRSGLTREAIDQVHLITGFERFDAPRQKQEVLDILVHDGYLRHDFERDRYVFVFNLLKDWWRQRYGASYKSISKRVAES